MKNSYQSTEPAIVVDFKEALNRIIRTRDLEIISDTVIKGITINETGRKYQVSPERVRQIKRRSIPIIRPVSSEIKIIAELENILKDYDLIHRSDLNDYSGSSKQLINLYNYIFKPVKKLKSIGPGFYSFHNKKEINKLIKARIDAGGGQIDIFEVINSLNSSSLSRQKIAELFSNFKMITCIYSNVYFGITKRACLPVIIKNFFRGGIDLNNEADFNRLDNYYKEFNSDSKVKDTKKSYLAVLSKFPDGIIKLGPGRFTHIDNDHILPTLLKSIIAKIARDLQKYEEVDINKYYQECQQEPDFIDVESRTHLYSRLRAEYGHRFNFYREPRIISGKTGEGQKPPKKDIFEDYIRSQGGSVERLELKEHFMLRYQWTAIQIQKHINNASNIIVEKIDNIKYVRLLN